MYEKGAMSISIIMHVRVSGEADHSEIAMDQNVYTCTVYTCTLVYFMLSRYASMLSPPACIALWKKKENVDQIPVIFR